MTMAKDAVSFLEKTMIPQNDTFSFKKDRALHLFFVLLKRLDPE